VPLTPMPMFLVLKVIAERVTVLFKYLKAVELIITKSIGSKNFFIVLINAIYLE